MWRNYDPFDDMWSSLRTMQRDLDSLFRRLPAGPRDERQLTTGETGTETLPFWSGYPLVDVWHEDDKLHVRAEVPGMKPEDIDVTVQEGFLVIRGHRRFEKSEKDKNWLVREVGEGTFERRFRLPEHVDAEKVEATYANGLLEVTLPASEEARPRRISVRASGGKKTIHAA